LNELSLIGTPDLDSLRETLRRLMAARRSSKNLSLRLYCSRLTAETQAIEGEPLLVSVSKLPRDEKAVILNWLGKSGPFLDDDRTDSDDDLYHLNGEDVTNLGAAEAARQCQKYNDGRLLSLNNETFKKTPLEVVHGLIEEPLGSVLVRNSWSFEEVKEWADGADPEPANWVELLDVSRRRYGHLLIGDHCDEVLGGQTFYPVVSRRVLELLRVLNTISGSIDKNGKLSASGEELKEAHFVGKKAWFSSESDGNKKEFANDMTFPDPADPSRSIECFWHGKIKTPQFRVHFEWPLSTGTKIIKVTYIGPKLSKK